MAATPTKLVFQRKIAAMSVSFRAIVALLVCIGFAACGPMYGGKPEKLKAPPVKKGAAGGAGEVKYDEECKADFFGDASRVKPKVAVSKNLLEAGNTAFASSAKAPDAAGKASLIIDAINKYKNSLIADPYNAESTYVLAVAYARVLKKGCSVALLKRLATLAKNPLYETDANRMISAAVDDSAFKGFRKDADSALGR